MIVLSQLTLVPVLMTHCRSVAEKDCAIDSDSPCGARQMLLLILQALIGNEKEKTKTKQQNGGSMSAGEQRDRMSCGM